MATGTAVSTLRHVHKSRGRVDDFISAEADEVAVMPLVRKCREFFAQWDSDKTPFDHVALVLPDDSLGGWKLIIQTKTNWLDPDRLDHFRLVTRRLREVLSAKEFRSLSRIVLIGPETTWNLRSRLHGEGRYENVIFNGVLMKLVFEIFSRTPAVARKSRKRAKI